MRVFWCLSSVLGLGLVCGSASAGTHWMCGLSQEGVQLVCVADPESDLVGEVAETRSEVRTAVRGTRFPLDANDVYTVDLWSVPDDAQWLEQLARATICYKSPGCTVSVAPVQGLNNHRPHVLAVR